MGQFIDPDSIVGKKNKPLAVFVKTSWWIGEGVEVTSPISGETYSGNVSADALTRFYRSFSVARSNATQDEMAEFMRQPGHVAIAISITSTDFASNLHRSGIDDRAT